MQVALRKRYLDFIRDKGLINGTVEFMTHTASINGPINPAQQFKIQTGVAKFPKPHARRRDGAYTCSLFRDGFECCDHIIDITAVGDTNRNADAMFFRRSASFIDDFAVAENTVRNRNLNIVAC